MKKTSIAIALALVALGGVSYRSLTPRIGVHAAGAFAADAFKGTYGFTEQGSFGTSTPLAGLGLLTADGFGNVSGSETLQIYGSAPQALAFQGTYNINPDGSGSLSLSYQAPVDPTADPNAPPANPGPTEARYDFVVVNGKLELHAIRADNGLVATATFVRQ